MHVEPWVWYVAVGGTTLLLLIDVFVIGRKPHLPSRRETTLALTAYISLAIAFGLGVWYFSGQKYAGEFFAGWLTEYSLSVDNLFIFLIIMAKFQVPAKYQQKALMIGIMIALVLRAIFIALGSAAIENFSWVFYLFGAFLIWTAIKLARESQDHDSEGEYEESALMRAISKRFPVTNSWEHGTAYRLRQGSKWLLTPFAMVIIALGSTDLLFALDSIPAIFGLTQEPFLVLMANIFALMGLRQLYFLLGDMLKRLVYLGIGLAVLLGFIGIKLVLHAMRHNELPFINGGEGIHWAPEIPIEVSLGAIAVILGITTIASLVKSRRDARAELKAADLFEPPGYDH